MARYAAAIVVILTGLSGPEMLAFDTESSAMALMPDAPPAYTPPPLTAAVRYHAPGSIVGWGSVDLSAHPGDHEFRVDVLLGAPVSDKRWDRCGTLSMDVDGVVSEHPTQYSGVEMDGGVYDAVRIELTIDDVRRMVSARDVHATICGDTATLPGDARARLIDFVDRFYEMATYDGPPPPKPPQELDFGVLDDEDPIDLPFPV